MAGSRSGVQTHSRTDETEALCTVLQELRTLVGWLEDMFNVSLPVPQFSSLSGVKGFLAEPLAPGSDHPWLRAVRGLKTKDRLSVLGSLFLFRKRIPVLVSPSLEEYQERMHIPSPAPDKGFMAFVAKEINRMFPLGWDRSWSGAVRGATLSVSSVIGCSRRDGGARGTLLRDGAWDRTAFCERLLDQYRRALPRQVLVRLAIAKTDGKDRIVGVNPLQSSYLSPLHNIMYDNVSKQDWCLRGEAKASRFSDFVPVRGEVFVSGDYESATDNLNIHVQRHILDCVLRRCTRVPLPVRVEAANLLDCVLDGPLGVTSVRRGQLMGNYLSFPLLCLANYLAFKWFVPRPVPVKINGDDIVFRSTPQEFDQWSNGVRSCGLTLSKGKTAVSPRWFSLNSTFFALKGSKVKLCPVIRSTCFFPRLPRFESLQGRFESLKDWKGSRGFFLRTVLLRRFSGDIWRSEISLRRGLGLRVSEGVLVASRLRDREYFYLRLPEKSDRIDAFVPGPFFRTSVPDGWVRVRSAGKDDPDFSDALVESCWSPQREDRLASSKKLCLCSVRFVEMRVTRLRARLLGLNLAGLRRFLRRPLPTFKKGLPLVWRRAAAPSAVPRVEVESVRPASLVYPSGSHIFLDGTRLVSVNIPPPERIYIDERIDKWRRLVR
nr:MAG: putative RNA-dependent RNA polymerase [Xiaogan botourmia-like virus 4]